MDLAYKIGQIQALEDLAPSDLLYKQLELIFDGMEEDNKKNYICVRAEAYMDENDTIYKFYTSVEQVHKAIMDIVSMNKYNVWFSHSSFFRGVRKEDSVRRLNTFFADIDPKDKETGKMNVEALMFFLNVEIFGRVVPYPSFVNFTGSGIQVFWLIEHVAGVKYQLKKWKAVEKRILAELKGVEEFVKDAVVDTSVGDGARIVRPFGSRNYKYSQVGIPTKCLMMSELRYTVDEIIDGYYPDMRSRFPLRDDNGKRVLTEEDIKRIEAYREASQARRNKWLEDEAKGLHKQKKQSKNAFKLLNDRKKDLISLIYKRNKRGIIQGYRDNLLYILGWTVIRKTHTQAQFTEILLEVNGLFLEPLPETQVTSKAKIIYETFKAQKLGRPEERAKIEAGEIVDLFGYYDRYRFTNDYIITLLDIEEDEWKDNITIKDSNFVKRENEKEKKKAARRSGKKKQTAKEKEADVNRRKVQRWKAKGLSQSEVAKKTKLGIATVKRYWK